MEVIMPSIKVNKKIFIPMCDLIMTRDNINCLPTFKTANLVEDPSSKQNRALSQERLKFVVEGDYLSGVNPQP
jgi:hypothetical protein